jgi:sulfhydrogenase subunit beta (sulfur reductase)
MKTTADKPLSPVSVASTKTTPSKQVRQVVMDINGLDQLFDLLHSQEYRTVGPTIKDRAITYSDIASSKDLPAGWTDTQDAASYRLEKHSAQTLFHYTVGPQSWKQFLYPANARLWRAQRTDTGINIDSDKSPEQKLALIGVRPCELNAILIQDKVFAGGTYKDPGYVNRRGNMLIVAVNCSKANKTCFCTSMACGPKAETGFDLALTEVISSTNHHFVIESGTPAGEALLKKLSTNPADKADIEAALQVTATTTKQMSRSVETDGLKDLLQSHPEASRWQDVGARCLNCANCTMVCPTCFCSTVDDITDLTGAAERHRKWDSCFTLDYSYIHGGNIRMSAQARYRQWLTHKMASWHDQFGSSGCTGCGRCITWCPVGIDITEEVRAIRNGAKVD